MEKLFLGTSILWLLGLLISFAAWITHFINTINDSEWILFLVGLFIPPVGILHGVGLWFGIFN